MPLDERLDRSDLRVPCGPSGVPQPRMSSSCASRVASTSSAADDSRAASAGL